MIIVINFTTTFVLTVKSLRPTEIRWNSCCYRLVKMPLQWVTHFATRFDLPLISIECRLKGNVFIFHYGACVFISSERLLQIIAPFFYRNVLESYLDQTDRWIRRKSICQSEAPWIFPFANSWLLSRYSIVQYRMGWKYLSDLFAVAFGVIRIDTIAVDAALTGVDTWITSGREKFRILLIVIPPTVGGPVQFQWSVVTVVLSAHCWIVSPYE
jgi:hypothetical protein